MKLTGTGKRFMGMKVRRACILLMAALLMAASGCSKKKVVKKRELVRPVKLMTVKDTTAMVRHDFPGTVRAARRAVLSFKVSGPLVELPVEEGRLVKKGDLIAQIQTRDFENAVKQAMARYREAEQQFRRYKELYAKKQVSKADYDRYRAARDVAKARLEDAQNALRDTTLRAPFDGVISKRYVENFQKVKAKEPIVNLQDISRIEILVDIPELMMAEIRDKKVAKLAVRFESIPGKEFPLKVKEYSTEADPATQTYRVVLVMAQPPEANIFPGMTATVTASYKERLVGASQAISVPAIAVLDAPGDHPYVWIFDPKQGIVHKREVKIGPLEGSADIKILGGVKPGEKIVIAGVTKLREGMKVRPWEKQREGK